MSNLPADFSARQEGLSPHRSFIIQAPAGSGKTGLLTQRFLNLLARVEQPEEVVAITFTRKAAGEMRSRIVEALRQASLDACPENDHAAQLWQLARAALAQDQRQKWSLLRFPSRLRILTFDALCMAIARQAPILSSLGGTPSITDDPEALYRAAARATVDELEGEGHWSDAMERLLDHLDNQRDHLEKMVATLLARRDQWLRHVIGGRAPSRRELERALAKVVEESLTKLTAEIPNRITEEFPELLKFAAANRVARGEGEWQGLLENPDPLSTGDAALWCKSAHLLLTNGGEWRRRLTIKEGFPAKTEGRTAEEKRRNEVMKGRMMALLEGLAEAESWRQLLAEVPYLPPLDYGDGQWQVLEALVKLLPMAAAQLHILFTQHGMVDFTEVAQRARAALGETDQPTPLALQWDYRIRHLLVDEFQDTSLSQFHLLERLLAGWEAGDGRTLFLVGDPMQSIYRFRQSEVGLFFQAREQGIGPVKLESLQLTVNFRSSPQVVAWVNRIFGQIFPPRAERISGAVPYADSYAHRAAVHGDEVSLHLFTENSLVTETEALATHIRALREKDDTGSIALLVRSRSHLVEILPMLRQAGIAYQAVEIDRLAGRMVVQDLVSLTRALLHYGDRISWLALLRAPWCGLTLADLLIIAGTKADKRTLWERMDDPHCRKQLSPDGVQRLERVWDVLARGLRERRRYTLRRWIEGIWLALGGAACVISPQELHDAEAYFRFLQEEEQGGDLPDLATFTRRLAALYVDGAAAGEGAVQVMTIHKAKGLEFDHVILPGLGRRPRPEQPPLLRWLERPEVPPEEGLLLAPIKATEAEEPDPIYRYVSRLEKRQEKNEACRLLYVATTRARHTLHLFGQVRPEDEEDEGRERTGRPDASSLLGLLWEAVAEEAEESSWPPLSDLATTVIAAKRGRLPANWHVPEQFFAQGIKPEQGFIEKSPVVAFDWAGERVRLVGIVVHRYLRQMAQEGISRWNEERVRRLRPHLYAHLLRLGLPQSEQTVGVTMVEKALLSAVQDATGRWILDGKHDEGATELALSGVLGSERVRVVIDRSFVENGVRWIIDFKSSFHEGGGLEQFLENERIRYMDQLNRYAAIMRQLDEDRPIRLGLYFPLLSGWCWWAWDAG